VKSSETPHPDFVIRASVSKADSAVGKSPPRAEVRIPIEAFTGVVHRGVELRTEGRHLPFHARILHRIQLNCRGTTWHQILFRGRLAPHSVELRIRPL
jgi:hypothetical protein